MSFHQLAREGINNIYNNDLENQKKFLSIICKTVRGMDNIDPLLKAEAFFVPNPDYIKIYFGPQSLEYDYDLYSWEGVCYWDNYVIFPIKNVVGTIVGFAGFDPINKSKIESNMDVSQQSYYRYSNSSVFNRGKYVYTLDGVWEKSIREGYVVVVDGIFDMLSLSAEGINAVSLLGSQLTDEVLFQLRFINYLYVAEDNDVAGRSLYSQLSKRHPNVKYVRQNITKDVDAILKTSYKDLYLTKLRESISKRQDLTLRLKPLSLG